MPHIPSEQPVKRSGWKYRVGKNVAGSGYKWRVRYFERYMPHAFAIRAARRWNLTPGTDHYNAGVMNGIEDLNGRLDALHGIYPNWDRQKAIMYVWKNLRKAYAARGIDVTTSGDLFRNWAHDWAPS